MFKFPLMKNNITKGDLDKLISYLSTDEPRLTNGQKVLEFENAWSKWLGVKHSIFVNSGSSANLLSIALLKQKFPDGGNVIVPPFTWVSDISACLFAGFKPKFVDIDLETLGLDTQKTIDAIDERTRAVFLTHAQGFNSLSTELLEYLEMKNVLLIEDVCESHGAKFLDKKCGTYGWLSNFSFYYAHHISTIEGGMICTNDDEDYQKLRVLRSHGLLRESNDENFLNKHKNIFTDLNPQFIFLYPGYNVRGTEINAVLGLNQLNRLDINIEKRNNNQELFYSNINEKKFRTKFNFEGSSNYAFNLILNDKDEKLIKNLCALLDKNSIEYRKGSAGGGNQLRQPYLKEIVGDWNIKDFQNTDHIHFFGMYIGNYPELEQNDIQFITDVINQA